MLFTLISFGALATANFTFVTKFYGLYFLWVLVEAAYFWYYGSFKYARAEQRPLVFERGMDILIVLEALSALAVAVFCGVGWGGAFLVLVTYLYVTRRAERMATERSMKDIFRILDTNQPGLEAEKKMKLALTMFEVRKQGINF